MFAAPSVVKERRNSQLDEFLLKTKFELLMTLLLLRAVGKFSFPEDLNRALIHLLVDAAKKMSNKHNDKINYKLLFLHYLQSLRDFSYSSWFPKNCIKRFHIKFFKLSVLIF